MHTRLVAIASIALMTIGLAACGTRERTVVVNPANNPPPSGTVVVPQNNPPANNTVVVPRN
jgi:hypothetical protein